MVIMEMLIMLIQLKMKNYIFKLITQQQLEMPLKKLLHQLPMLQVLEKHQLLMEQQVK